MIQYLNMRVITNPNRDEAVREIIEAIMDYDEGCTLGGPSQPKLTINPANGYIYIPPSDNEIKSFIIAGTNKNVQKKQTLMSNMTVMTMTEKDSACVREIDSDNNDSISWRFCDIIDLHREISNPLIAISIIVYDPNGLIIPNPDVASGRLMPLVSDITIYSNFIETDLIFAPRQKYPFGLELIKQIGRFGAFNNTISSFFVHNNYSALDNSIIRPDTVLITKATKLPINQPPSNGKCTICDTPVYDYYTGLLDPSLLYDKSTKDNHIIVCQVCMQMKFTKYNSIVQSGNGVSPLIKVFSHSEHRPFPIGAIKFPSGIPEITNDTKWTISGSFIKFDTNPPVIFIPGPLNAHYHDLYDISAFNAKILQVKIAF